MQLQWIFMPSQLLITQIHIRKTNREYSIFYNTVIPGKQVTRDPKCKYQIFLFPFSCFGDGLFFQKRSSRVIYKRVKIKTTALVFSNITSLISISRSAEIQTPNDWKSQVRLFMLHVCYMVTSLFSMYYSIILHNVTQKQTWNNGV